MLGALPNALILEPQVSDATSRVRLAANSKSAPSMHALAHVVFGWRSLACRKFLSQSTLNVVLQRLLVWIIRGHVTSSHCSHSVRLSLLIW